MEESKLANEKNGITEEMKQSYLSEIAKVDEFHFFKEGYIIFDSKENLDKNYEGNLYYYFK